MRIAYIITRADAVGGATIHVRDLAGEVARRGHKVMVFVGGTGPVTDQLARAGVPFTPLKNLQREISPFLEARALGELTAALKRWQPDLVSTHTAKAGWLGRAAAARLGLPALYTPHGLPVGDRMSRLHGTVFSVAERMAANWSRRIICVSEHERQLALSRRIAHPDKLIVIHNGVRDVPERAQPDQSPVRVVSVARFEPPKDHATLLEALALLQDEVWSLDFVGDGPLEPDIRRKAAALGLHERIRFLGYLPEPAAILADAQLFVLASRSEGFPRSILEAMRAGLPVVATEVGGISEAIEHGRSGLLVPRQDAGALAGALRELIRDRSRRQLYGAAARQTYESRFRLEVMVEKTLAAYATVERDR